MNQSVNANSTRVPGLVRDRGIDRTSITRPTPDSRKRSTNSTIVRVEWPIVKKVFVRRSRRRRRVTARLTVDSKCPMREKEAYVSPKNLRL
jgi:hypothetical protein